MSGSTHSRMMVAIALMAVSVLPILQAGMVAPVLASIADNFADWKSPTLAAQLVLVAPTLAIILTAPWVGGALDRDRRNRLILVALGLYGASGVWCFFAQSPAAFVLARLVLGICVAAILAATPIMIARHYYGADRQGFLGLQASVVAIAGATTPILAGVIAMADWRFVFAPYLVAWLLIPAMIVLNRNTAPAGALTAPAAASRIRSSEVAPICLRIFLLWLMLYLLTTQLAFHLRSLNINSAMDVGIGLGTASAAAAVSSLAYAKIKPRAGFREISGTAFLLSALGYVIIAYADSRPALAFGLILSGLGFGLNIPNAANWLIETVDAGARGRAFGWLTFATYLGQLISVPLYAQLAGATGSAGAFLFVAAVAIMVGAISFVSITKLRPAIETD